MQKIKPFLFGILAALGALIAEFILSDAYFIFSGKEIGSDYSEKITVFLFLIVLIEELTKYIMILKLYDSQPAEKQRISTAILLGLGFAIVESSFLYLHQNFSQLYLGIASTVILHIVTAGVIGHLIISTKNVNKIPVVKIVLIAFGLHIAYNLMVIYNCGYTIIYAYLAIIVALLIILNRKFNHTYKSNFYLQNK